MITKIKTYILTLLIAITTTQYCYAHEVINITRGSVAAIPTAINDFAGVDPADLRLGQQIVEVITNDLRNSGIFRPISKAAFIERKGGVDHKPLFEAWQQINANLLINGRVTRNSSNKVRVEFILWDTMVEKEMLSETFELAEKNWRRSAHKIADSVYEKITGYQGYFDTQIVYVAESGPYTNRIKRIAIMDQDGANHRYLTNGSDLVLTPRFSPDGRKILYMSYKSRIPQVYEMDVVNGKSKLLGHFPGMSFAPRFSPDGEYAIMSIAKKGITNIYEINLRNKKLKQLTVGSSINTSPCYSPDGKRIVFQSDREGSRQLYIMDRDGSNTRRISFSGGSYAEPNWSKNNYIAFTKTSREHGFTIGVIKADTSSEINTERLISSAYLVESPSWLRNGRLVTFTKGIRPQGKYTKGLNRIFVIDFTGHNERLIPTPSDASDPDWSAPRP